MTKCLEFLDYNLPCDLVVYCCVLIHTLLTVFVDSVYNMTCCIHEWTKR